jgi:hypothetical protein
MLRGGRECYKIRQHLARQRASVSERDELEMVTAASGLYPGLKAYLSKGQLQVEWQMK